MPIINEVENKIKLVKEKIYELENDTDLDAEFTALLIKGYKKMILKGEAFIRTRCVG